MTIFHFTVLCGVQSQPCLLQFLLTNLGPCHYSINDSGKWHGTRFNAECTNELEVIKWFLEKFKAQISAVALLHFLFFFDQGQSGFTDKRTETEQNVDGRCSYYKWKAPRNCAQRRRLCHRGASNHQTHVLAGVKALCLKRIYMDPTYNFKIFIDFYMRKIEHRNGSGWSTPTSSFYRICC